MTRECRDPHRSGVPAREEDLYDLDRLVGESGETAEQLEDGLVVTGRARVDQAEPVALTNGVRVDEIAARHTRDHNQSAS